MNMNPTTCLPLSPAFDTSAEGRYNEDAVRQIAEEAAHQAVADLLTRLMSGEAMLDNSKSQTQSYSNEDRLTLTVQEVADQLGISKPSVYSLIKDGMIHSIRIGRKILIPRQAVAEYLAN